MNRRTSLSVGLGLCLAIVLDTVVQFTWKSAAGGVPASVGPRQTLLAMIAQPLFHLTLALWVAQFINWTLVLSRADLSFAQPITALSYVTVALAGRLFLHEQLPPTRIVGIALIVLGVWQISATHNSADEASPAPAANEVHT